MAHLTADNRAAEFWGDNDVPPARFTMTGRLQVSQVPNNYHSMQPLDFSVAVPRSPPPAQLSPQPAQPILPAALKHEDAVDLTMRVRSGNEESSCSSVASDIKPLSPYLHEPIPPAFPFVFKKSPSMTRPFKAYPKDPLNLPMGLMGGLGSAESLLNQASKEAYEEFRRQMLAQVVAAKTRRSPESSSPMRGHEQHMMGQQTSGNQPEEAGSPQHPSSSNTDPSVIGGVGGKDQFYWERRRKNNEAAKRSRDARRAKEDEIAIRATFLEQENLKLKYEVAALRNENGRLRCLIYNNPS